MGRFLFRRLTSIWYLFFFLVLSSEVSVSFASVSCNSIDDQLEFRFGQETPVEYSIRTDQLRRACEKPWLILIDMDADSDLFGNSVWDLHEMEASLRTRAGKPFAESEKKHGKKVGSGSNLDVVIQWRLPGGRRIRRLHVWENPQVEYRATDDARKFEELGEGIITSPIIDDQIVSEARDRSIETAEFMQWARAKYPSQHLMMVFWGHHEGLFGKRSSEIRDILARDRDNQHRNGNYKKIDVLALDACFAAKLELTTEFAQFAHFYFAPSGTQSALGLPYRRFLREIHSGHLAGFASSSELITDSPLSPLGLAKMLPRVMGASLSGRALPRRFDRSVSQYFASSSWDLSLLESEVLPAWRAWASTLLEWLNQGGEESRFVLRLAWDLASQSPTQAYRGNDSLVSWLQRYVLELRSLGQDIPLGEVGYQNLEEAENLVLVLRRARVSHFQAKGVPEASVGMWLPASREELEFRQDEYLRSFSAEIAKFWLPSLNRLY